MSLRQVCVRHPEREGVGVCMSCRRVVCEECGGREEGILRCRECLAERLRERSSRPRSRRWRDGALGLLASLSALSLLALGFFQLLRVAALWGN